MTLSPPRNGQSVPFFGSSSISTWSRLVSEMRKLLLLQFLHVWLFEVPLCLSVCVQARNLCVAPVRWLNLHEYQSKQLMQQYGVAVQRFEVCETASDAAEAAKRLGVEVAHDNMCFLVKQ